MVELKYIDQGGFCVRIVLCTDERLGISFCGRRQSRDKILTRDILSAARGGRLLIKEYSRLLFAEASIDLEENGILVSEDPFSEAKDEDAVLIELSVSEDQLLLANEIVLYNWNRHYPATERVSEAFLEKNFELSDEYHFCGNSHENLTRYTLKHK